LPKSAEGNAVRNNDQNRLLMAVIVRVMLASFLRVMLGVDLMPVRHVRVMTGLLVVATFVMLGGRVVMFRGMLVMFSGFAVMFRSFL
jgi:hypothetical protein